MKAWFTPSGEIVQVKNFESHLGLLQAAGIHEEDAFEEEWVRAWIVSGTLNLEGIEPGIERLKPEIDSWAGGNYSKVVIDVPLSMHYEGDAPDRRVYELDRDQFLEEEISSENQRSRLRNVYRRPGNLVRSYSRTLR